MREWAAIVMIATAVAASAAGLPDDVETFVQKRRECDHWRGEDPSVSAERRAQIEEATRRVCVGTDRQLATLKQKYRSSKPVMEVLDEFEPRIEP